MTYIGSRSPDSSGSQASPTPADEDDRPQNLPVEVSVKGASASDLEKLSEGKLSEAQVNKIRLMTSLIKVMKHFENGKTCIISALVYIDRLVTKGDVIPLNSLHW